MQGHAEKIANWQRWSCQITRLSSVDECHGCALHDVPSKAWTPVTVCDEHCWPVFELVLTPKGLVNGEVVYVLAEGQQKQNRRADGTCCPSVLWSSHLCWQREEQRVRVFSRSRDEGCTRMPPKGKRS